MHTRLGLILAMAALLPAVVLGAGCGSDDTSKGDSSAPEISAPSRAKNVPTDADQLKNTCVDELKQSGQSEERAKKMCTVPDDADVDKAAKAAAESCLAIAKQLPAGSVRDQAEQDCRDSLK